MAYSNLQISTETNIIITKPLWHKIYAQLQKNGFLKVSKPIR